jgi:CRP/FNR family cyclic AMP-dependent transcriptional regulator
VTDLEQARDTLRRAGWLSLVPEEFREQILLHARLRRYAAGEAIYHVGDPPGGLFGLVKGAVEIAIAPERQGPYVIHFAGPGFWIGETALITGGPRLASLYATRDTSMVHIDLAHLQQVLNKDPKNWRWLGLLTLLHVQILLGIIDDLTLRDVEKRCVAILLRLAGIRVMFDQKDPSAPIEASQDALAAMANVSRNTLGSTLRGLQARGLVDIRYRNIRIVDPVGLSKILDDT